MVREINKLIIHCSDSPDNKDFDMFDVNSWHEEKKFPPASNGMFCGYHWVIKRDGTVQNARPDTEPGVHCKGHNKDSIAICLIGSHDFTPMQFKSLDYLLMNYMSMYGLEPKQVFGHCEFDTAKAQGKTCPNFKSMDKFRDDLEFRYRGGDNGFRKT